MPVVAPEPATYDFEAARAVAKRVVARGELPCLVFGVSDAAGRGAVVAISGQQTSVAEDSVFFIASVTKAIMATALMQYVDEGRLDLHTPLVDYLPEAAGGPGSRVSAWHLLTHTSGLPDMPADRIRAERPDYAAMLAKTLGGAPQWEPGTRYEYNSSAWVLLSELMARLSMGTFPEVLRQRLTGPLGMVDTVFDARPLRSRIVPVQGVNAGNRVAAEVLLWFLARATFPGGGMFGTVGDLLRLGRSLLPSNDGSEVLRLLSRSSVEEMARQQIDGIPLIEPDGMRTFMQQGLGWRKSGGAWPAGDSVLTHGGKSGARLWVDPKRDLAYVFLTNVWDAPSDAAIAVLAEVNRAIDATD